MNKLMFAVMVGALCVMGQKSVRAEEAIIIEPRVRPEVVVPVPVVPVPSCKDNYDTCTNGCEARYTSPWESHKLSSCIDDCRDTYKACKDE